MKRGNSIYGGQTSKNIYLGDTRIVTKLNSGENPTYQEESRKQYYYHSDHLGSAAMISDHKGDEYQRLEYTPYGETWVEKTQNTGLEYLPYKFTAKELDEETGLYYYGARYLDPKYSMWLSCDPALGEYVSQTSKGEGGIYNSVNLNLYHYAGNNPIKYTDPDGRIQCEVQEKYTMQDGNWSTKPIKNTDTPISKAGCAIVASANFTNSLGTDKGLDPKQVNDEYVNSEGNMNFAKIATDCGYTAERKYSQFTFDTLKSQVKDENWEYYTLVNVNYDSDGGDHWVGVKGGLNINGAEYLIVSPTSNNDRKTSENDPRGKQGWEQPIDGFILVPVSETKGYVNFKKEINNEN